MRWKWEVGSIALWDNVSTWESMVSERNWHSRREQPSTGSYQGTMLREHGVELGPLSLERSVSQIRASSWREET
jgi:hypothetical protein